MLASAKKIDITAPIGFRMAGFFERDHGSEGILNNLYASILIIENAGDKVVFVALDLIGVDHDFVKKVRTKVSKLTDIKDESVLIGVTHTHSGPDASRMCDGCDAFKRSDMSEVELSYYNLLIEKIVGGIVWANNSLVKVDIFTNQSELIGIGSNRIDSSFYANNTLTTVSVRNKTGTLLAVLTNYSCHPTILNKDNYLFSGDYISFYRNKMEEMYPGVVIPFFQGCSGNNSTRHYRQADGIQEAQRMGNILADAVIDNLKDSELLSGRLSYKITDIEFKARSYESDEVCLKKIAETEKEIDDLKRDNAPVNIQRTAYVKWQGATRYLEMKHKSNFQTMLSEMQLIKIGDLHFITTPGETFGEIGRSVMNLDNKKKIVVTAYCNGYVGYIPDKHTFENPKGYEVDSSFVNEESEDIIVRGAQKLLSKE